MDAKSSLTVVLLSLVALLMGACVGAEFTQSQLSAVSPTTEAQGTQPITTTEVVAESVTITESAMVSITYELMNMTYQSAYTHNGTAPLIYGQYREQLAPGSTSEVSVKMMTNTITLGELNGEPVAAVILVTNPAGSGSFHDLAVVMEQDGEWTNVATVLLGDQIIINSVTIANNQIIVDMVTHAPNDPICCPTQRVVQSYTLMGDELVLVSP